ncbi:conserved hypothetical protein [Leishmania major strain Friedlin]|uniref:Uncharacterized protein n=1 Tax=Leishmania major TaxID=5664 RepID=Q4Q282_LEIMA|nr:conserved hypothetical protein [Leishmania major strain Friedlin]CAG9582347.1 hypothetical_protein_-_conserved [Leishmania major strain Friedlin]CAJ08205.1 conserved hypothetical protein [Leishmania major strain Friedlin]|eukprot:XP_001686566.1 conserved hypothetical protein [Leishmania major strain Friedlin]
MSIGTDYLSAMLNYNGCLQERILRRLLIIENETDSLLALRCALVPLQTPTRKRKRHTEPVAAQGTSFNVDVDTTRHRWSTELCEALNDEAAKANCIASLCPPAKERWCAVAAALRRAGHPSFTPYELFTKYKEMHSDSRPFALSEARFVCQYVQEHGGDWQGLCQALRQRLGHVRSPFQVAQQYRQRLRCAFVENRLTSSQLLTLLADLPASPQDRDFAALSVEAQRFTSHKTLQVSPLYLKRELEPLDFAARVPTCHHLYWKLVNLLCNFTLSHPNRLHAFQHRMPFCYQQRSLADLARSLQCEAAELQERVVHALLRLSRPPEALNYEECSKKLFGTVCGAQLIYQISEKLHEKDI